MAAAAPAAAAAAPTLTEVTRATVQAGAAATGPPKMDENRNPQGPAGGAPVAPVDDGDLPWVPQALTPKAFAKNLYLNSPACTLQRRVFSYRERQGMRHSRGLRLNAYIFWLIVGLTIYILWCTGGALSAEDSK